MTEVESQLREVAARLALLELENVNLRDQVGQALQLAKLNGGNPGFGGGGNLIRGWLPTGIAAGTFGSPGVATDAIFAVRSGNGWTTSGGQSGKTVYNSDATAVTGAKAAWFTRRDDNTAELLLADC